MRLDHLLSTEFCGRTVVRRYGDALQPGFLLGGVPCWLGKGQGACALVVWVDSGVVHAVGFPDRQAPCRGWCSVPAVLAVPLCGVGAWGGVVWWFENWRVDASMNGVPCGVCRVCSYC